MRRLSSGHPRPSAPAATWGALWRRAIAIIDSELGPRGVERVDAAIAAYLATPVEDRVAFTRRESTPSVANAPLWQIYVLAVHKNARTPDGQDTAPASQADILSLPGPAEDGRAALRHYAAELQCGRRTGDVLRAGHAAVAVRGLALGLAAHASTTPR